MAFVKNQVVCLLKHLERIQHRYWAVISTNIAITLLDLCTISTKIL